jgi:hypothetical protein
VKAISSYEYINKFETVNTQNDSGFGCLTGKTRRVEIIVIVAL